MHNKIYQITEQKLAKDSWINEQSFVEYNIGDFADYIYDINDQERKYALESLDTLLKGIFERKGNILTYLGAEDFVNDWIIKLKDMVAEVDCKNFKDWQTTWNIRHMIEDTHLNSDARFYIGENYEATADPFGEFIRDVYSNNKAGDKFFIGGIVGYHF